MAHALNIHGLVKRFGERPILGPIDLRLEPGSITAVIGRSGCGKTTLLRCLGGLEKPDGGTIRIGPGTLRRDQIGYVFQEARLMPWLTVAGNVAFGLPYRPAAARRAAVAEALALVGLLHAADMLPKQLSGGMAQRVALARALVSAPGLLLLDEPFSALDPFTREAMQDHLLHLHRHYRTTMVLITHDMDEALSLADRIIVLSGAPGLAIADLIPALDKPCQRTAEPFVDWKARLNAILKAGGRGQTLSASPAQEPTPLMHARPGAQTYCANTKLSMRSGG